MAIFGSVNSVYRFDLQGHRGARGLAPENTLAGFEAALRVGVSTLELDLGMTRDDVLVVVHNPYLEPELTRDSLGNWLSETGPAISSLTFQQLKEFDVGRLNPQLNYAKSYPKQIPKDGSTIPALFEVFEFVEKLGGVGIQYNIEIKTNPERPDLTPSPRNFTTAVIDMIRKYGLEKKVTIQSFDWQVPQMSQKIEPEISTSYLTAQQSWLDNVQLDKDVISPWLAGFNVNHFSGDLVETVKAAGGGIWAPFFREVDSEKIKAAHKKGLLVKVWTVNDPQDMETLIDMGVNGIITDYPDILRNTLSKKFINLPSQIPGRN